MTSKVIGLAFWYISNIKLNCTIKELSSFLKVKSLSRVQLFATPWTVAYEASLSMGFSRQEYWSGLPFHSPGDLPDPGIEPGSPTLEAEALTSEPPGKPKLSVYAYIYMDIYYMFFSFFERVYKIPFKSKSHLSVITI